MKSVLTTQVCDIPFIFQNMASVIKKCNECQRDIGPDEFYIKTVNTENESFDVRYHCFNHIFADILAAKKELDTLKTTNDNLKSRFVDIDSDFKKLDSKYIDINTKFERLDAQFEQLNTQFSELKQFVSMFKELDAKFSELNNKLVIAQSDKPKPRKKKTEDPVTLTVIKDVQKIDV